MEVGKFKYESNPGAWYVQGQTPSPEFTEFVDTYLNKWTGFVAETVFDVNCLVLDESHVIFSAYNRDVFDFCRRHGIEPIICELRHSYFWDGGISCCTQDIRRRGGLETYL
jgi:glycine amidinotransferase